MAIVVAQSAQPHALTERIGGVVVAVDGPDLARVDNFTLRTDDGRTLAFEVEVLALTDGGKPAPHLREHLASGEPVEVEYRDAGGRLLAVRYRDAPESS
ncbi:MAG TPA: hypothetical protein VM305_10065 [Candidatus Limnocylindrales bacterium]|nr:hypothetical protein [Candidatus Limnocylindrales bacterium]